MLRKQKSNRRRGLSGHLLNVALLAVFAYAVFRPGGPLDTYLVEREEQKHFGDLAQEHWHVLAATSARLGGGESSSDPILVEFGDYECPFCRRSHHELQRVLARLPDLTVGFRHYPLDRIHDRAETAARAAICAEAQGRFQEMHSVLLESSEWRDLDDWTALLEQVGIPDVGRYERCLTGKVSEERLAEDRRLAELLEVTGTPTYFYRYGAHVGYLDEDQLIELVENAR